MTMIVTSNYRNPNSEERWLLRDDKRPYVSAMPHRAVVAHGVRFGESPYDMERGFGSRRVAFCSGAQGSTREIPVEKQCFLITFDGYNFLDPDGKPIAKCDTMYFLPDGNMYGMLIAKQSAEREPEKAAA